jgi:putative tricarboxylic transport membrane protein
MDGGAISMTPAILLLLFGAVTAGMSLQIRVGTLRAPGSGFFPFYLGLLLILLAAIHLGQSRRAGQVLAGSAEAPSGSPAGSWRRVLSFLGAIALGIALLSVLGYPLVAFLLMSILLYLLGLQRWSAIVSIALCAAGASYLLFVRWLQIPLPKGWLGL